MNSEINGNNINKVNMKRTHEAMTSPNKTSPKSETASFTNKRHGDHISGSPPKKKIKNGAPAPQPKNSVAMLNELRQGLIYTLEGQSGPVHAPIFTMSVEVMLFILNIHVVVALYKTTQQVDGQKYNGQGRSKKIARIQAAQTALRSFIQFKDGAILSPSKPSNNVDFTSDEHLENGIIIKKEALLDSSKYYFSFCFI